MLQSVNTYSPAFKGTVEYKIDEKKLAKLKKETVITATEDFYRTFKDNNVASAIDLFKTTTDDTHKLEMCLTTYKGKPYLIFKHLISSSENRAFGFPVNDLTVCIPKTVGIPNLVRGIIREKCTKEQIINGLKKLF